MTATLVDTGLAGGHGDRTLIDSLDARVAPGDVRLDAAGARTRFGGDGGRVHRPPHRRLTTEEIVKSRQNAGVEPARL